MKSLNDILWSPFQRDAFAADLERFVETHVASRGGLRGFGLKAGLALLKAAKPDLLGGALRRNAPQFIAALQPLYERFQQSREPDFSVFLQRHAAEAGAALLAVADTRLAASQNGALRSAYHKLRGSAEAEIDLAVPALGRLIRGYL
ncbi:DUF6918 family protein [Solimonas flava]|uniref:DUF6918 family protein n=1 Tax=Solimonas flava TaxID=415849 RepID=UPI000422527B|nr:hypothetical protein [Solimonas flava]